MPDRFPTAAGPPGESSPYRGRFAPSPTGPLHLGSLLCAVASYADARAHGGIWLVRIEDIDRPRERPGAADRILFTLEAFGFEWDEAVVYQSRRTAAYRDALECLAARGLTYPCGCTRAEVAAAGSAGPEGPIYPGTCGSGLPAGRRARTTRFRASSERIDFDDRIQGPHSQRVAESVGDFVLRRADGLYAYQLAVVVDDARQGIGQVVRGADLLFSTPRQILLQQALDYPRPAYAHLPVLLDEAGQKLGKSSDAAAVDPRNPMPALRQAWALLGQEPIPEADGPSDFWSRAIPHWSVARVPSEQSLRTPSMIRSDRALYCRPNALK